MGRYSPEQISAFVEATRRDGLVVLPSHLPAETISEWSAHFAPLLEEHIAREGERQNCGSGATT